MSLGGMRVYSDEDFGIGSRLEIDLLTADGDEFVTCLTQVMWIRPLDADAPARFDVGLRFLEIPERARAMIEDLVSRALVRESSDDVPTP